ncbi:MAG: AAA family ATPase [Clostridiales bacterium]|nr:AAA family ATPase [Clostridiales bacterium]
MNLDTICNQIYIVARNEAKLQKHQYITPEHFLYASLMFDIGKELIENSGGNVAQINKDLQLFFKQNLNKLHEEGPAESFLLIEMFDIAAKQVYNSEKNIITLGNLVMAIFSLKDSYASYILKKNNVDRLTMIRFISQEAKTKVSYSPLFDKPVQEKTSGVKEREGVFLERFAYSLTERARSSQLDPVIGREDVLERTIQVLSRRVKNNPIHVGYPGVGKTAVVEGLAQKIAEGSVPDKLKGADIFYVDMSAILAGTKYRGDFEERFIKLIEIISKYNNPIIYLDEIHNIVGAGAVSGGGMDASSILKPYLSKGKIKFIGSTTYDEFKKHFEKDKALLRRFQKIDIEEPSINDSIEILKGVKEKYESFHNVIYGSEILKLACELSDKYINDRHLPDKAIDAIDETGAFLRMHSPGDEPVIVTRKDLERTISLMSRVPTDSVSADTIQDLKGLDGSLKTCIFGQDKAIADVVDAIKLSRSGLKDENKPVASLLFVGPTGVGKTEVAKQISEKLSIKLLRFDMSEYQEKHSIAKLIGSPPGYVGFDEGGILTEEIRRNPHCVLLLDEIEKAHPDVFNVLLQVMDYGTLTDNIGKKADFRNAIIIMTSNAGARELGRPLIGFDNRFYSEGEINKAVEKTFSPEFRNRLDGIVVFNNINLEMAINITRKGLSLLGGKLAKKNISLEATDELVNYIAEKGLSNKYGAREILRVINNDIKKLLVDEILFGDIRKGGVSILDYKSGEILLSVKMPAGMEV